LDRFEFSKLVTIFSQLAKLNQLFFTYSIVSLNAFGLGVSKNNIAQKIIGFANRSTYAKPVGWQRIVALRPFMAWVPLFPPKITSRFLHSNFAFSQLK
jgi:hypothetical protein